MAYKCAAQAAEWRKNNKTKLRANMKRFNDRHPAKVARWSRARKLRAKYGMSIADFDRMLLAQGTKCAICKSRDPGRKEWCVDHDHATGKVRAILCNSCNSGLGHFKDSEHFLIAAAAYIRGHSDVDI